MLGRGSNPATCEYTVAEAENGFIFSHYIISQDKIEYWIAKTPEELAEIIRAWQEARIEQMIAWQTSKQK